MKKCVKSQRCKNLVASYFLGCIFAILFAICMSINNIDSGEFKFGFYLFLFCQIVFWEPISICTILIIYKIRLLPSILDNLWQCVMYASLPSLLILTDASCGNAWIKLFNVDSIIFLIFVYLSYYVAILFIALIHRIIISIRI